MKSLWNDNDAKKFNKSLLSKRVYTSRLLGQNSDLVLHGGGNTSVKIRKKDFFGNSADYLYVKGSGCDLETIEEKDFSGCKMSTLLKLSDLDLLSDTEMVNQCRSSMIDPNSSNPSNNPCLRLFFQCSRSLTRKSPPESRYFSTIHLFDL